MSYQHKSIVDGALKRFADNRPFTTRVVGRTFVRLCVKITAAVKRRVFVRYEVDRNSLFRTNPVCEEVESNDCVARFKIRQIPGCCAFAAVHELEINPAWMEAVFKAIPHIAKGLNYASVFYTHVKGCDVLTKMKKLGWRLLHEKYNPRTGNTVQLIGLDVQDLK